VASSKSKRERRPRRAAGAGAASASASASASSASAAAATDPATRALARRALLRSLGIVAAFGLLIPLAYPTPDVWPLAFVSLAGLAWQLRTATRPRRAMLLGFTYAFAANLAGYYWITGLLISFGGFPFAAAFPCYLLLAAYQAMLYGVWAWGVVWLREHGRVPLWASGPALLAALEYTVPLLFPWALGESQYLDRPLAQCADLFGVFGLTVLVALVNLALEEGVWRRWLAPPAQRTPVSLRLTGAVAALVAAAFGYGFWRVHEVDARAAAAPKLRVAMVQPNIGIFDKHDEATGLTRGELLQSLTVEAERAGAELALWPEASYPGWLVSGASVIPPGSRPHRGFTVPLAFGTLRIGPPEPPGAGAHRKRMNSLVLAGPDGVVMGAYDKNFLVWFSEKIPFSDYMPWIDRVLPYSADFEPGRSVPLWDFRGFKLAPNICFEDTLPRWTAHLEGAPDLIVNSTEDAWFGATTEPYFHIAFATFRAIESHTAMVRSVNTGPSAVIDPAGRIVRASGIFTRDVLVADVPMMHTVTVYQRVGDALVWACFGAVAAMTALALVRRRRRTRAAAAAAAA
jgi:apolipoprotein N-acyltransferase